MTSSSSPAPAAKRVINIAVVGLGYWGRHYARITNASNRVRLVALCDMSPEARATYNTQYPNVMMCASIDEMMTRCGDGADRLDAAVIATPASLHFGPIKQLLEAKVHVLAEKPLTTDEDEATELVACAREHSATLFVGHTFLFNAAIRRMKAMYDGGCVGRLHCMYATRTNLGPFRNDVNCMWDLAPHDVSIFNYVVGRLPDWVSAHGSKPLDTDREDVVYITLSYGGALAHIHCSWLDPKKVRTCVLVGSEGRLEFDDMLIGMPLTLHKRGIRPAVEPTSAFEHSKFVHSGDILIPEVRAHEPLSFQFNAFLDSMGKQEFLSDARFGHGVVATLAAASKSLAQDGAKVYLQK